MAKGAGCGPAHPGSSPGLLTMNTKKLVCDCDFVEGKPAMSTKGIVIRDFGGVISEDGLLSLARSGGDPYFLAGEQVEGLERVETAPYTQRVFEILENRYSALNSWCHTWPHFEVENVAEKRRQEMRACLEAQVEGLPLEVGIVALRRCFLVYQSDGDARTQTDYLYVAPPGSQCNY